MGKRAGLNGGVRTAWAQRKGREGKGRERKGKEGKGRERKGKEGKGRERKGKDGKGRKKEGKGRERKGKEGKGMSGKRSRWRSASSAARTAADGKWVENMRGRLRTAWVQGSGWKWVKRRSRWR